MTFCGEGTRARERTFFGNIGDGFLIASLTAIYSGNRTGYDSKALSSVLDDGVALIERDIGLVGDYGRRFPPEFEAQVVQLPEYQDRLRVRNFLAQSKERINRGERLPQMPQDVSDTLRQMIDRRLASLRP